MYNIIPKFFCFCNNNLLCFMLFLFFLYFQSILKKLSTRCTSQFVGLWPGWGWGCRSEYGSQIQEYIPQSKVCGLRKCFLIHPRECLKRLSARCAPQFAGDLARMKVLQRATTHPTTGKIYCKVGGCGLRNDFQIHLRALFVLFCCYFVIFSIMRCSILSLYNLFVLIRIV